MNEGLKPCPFCGGKAKIHKILIDFCYKEFAYSVFCEECQSQTRYSNTKSKAKEEWNRRYKDESK